MPDSNQINFVRDKDGRVISIQGEMPPELMSAITLTPFVDSIRNSVETLNKDTNRVIGDLQKAVRELDANGAKSAKRMEWLTILLSGLTIALIIETAILIIDAVT